MTAPETVGTQTQMAEETRPTQLTPEQAMQFAEAFERNRNGLMGHAVRLTYDHEKAEDLVQEAFFKAIRGANSFTGDDSGMRSWLYTIMENTFFTDARKAQTARKHGFDSNLDIHSEAVAVVPRLYWGNAPVPIEDQVVSETAVTCLIDSIVHTLGENGKREDLVKKRLAALLLTEEEGYPKADVAEILETPISTVGTGKLKLERELRPILHQLLKSA